MYPFGVRNLADGGTFDTLAGQPTDDGELMLTLATSLVTEKKYAAKAALQAYKAWYASHPFDCGLATRSALTSSPLAATEANGALMRAAALGVYGANVSARKAAKLAKTDAALTHPSTVCQDANALYVLGIAHAVRTGCTAEEVYDVMLEHTSLLRVHSTVFQTLSQAWDSPPKNEAGKHGWVLHALQNAVFQLLHAQDFETCLVSSIGLGYDTDTNAAIAGALYGAVYGVGVIPERWLRTLRACAPGGRRPRPKKFWPRNADRLTAKLAPR